MGSVKKAFDARNLSVTVMVRASLLVAASVVLKFIDFQIPIFVNFLKLDLGDIPAAIGAASMGPQVGVFIELLKNVLKLLIKNETIGIGELADFVVGSAYVSAIGIACYRKKTTLRYAAGAAIGTLAMIISGSLLNYFIVIPMYASVFGMPIHTIVAMGTKINPSITDLKSLVVLSVAPFNLLKGAIISAVGFSLYRILKRFL